MSIVWSLSIVRPNGYFSLEPHRQRIYCVREDTRYFFLNRCGKAGTPYKWPITICAAAAVDKNGDEIGGG
ncbi:hypothetical protein HYE67_003753 [Fusarium culmorum]|uniref:Uncharacterized protein n=1 Tax=Fusarium culmorum TaxID=5516 RepID=A0A2T4GJZ7_FUSCU|nr:hypothetical protein FCULG_00000910 [Fusarium culmorum]QPC61522.1 hypothetical protein HYE67_003753 [Fusarium culmorum]